MKQILSALLAAVVLLIVFVLTGIYLPVEMEAKEEIEITVNKGEGAKEIAEKLKDEDIIRWSSPFRAYVLFKGISAELKAGKYFFSKSMDVPEISRKLVLGEVVREKITIIEGWNMRDISSYFEEKGLFGSEKPLGLSASGFDYDFLEGESSLEGYLFPDTYEVYPDADIEEIVFKILKNFNEKTLSLREEIEKQGKTISEIITMASLIEKEVRTKEDKKLVSGLLWKRIESNMPLQVDSTITYITGKKSTKVSTEETKIDSLYNTYKYKGLPLGPICSPGLDSIEAAVYPQESSYWYYLSTPEGETIFSRTLEEHNMAKAIYLK